MKHEEYFCDICKKSATHLNTHLQVIFETEQNEGHSVKPYLQYVKIDICEECYDSILTGKTLFASGAMGYNNYYFKKI